MSPLCIEILLWHYCRANPYPWHEGGSAQLGIRQWLLDEGLLSQRMNRDTVVITEVITERGRVLVEALCATPLPVQKWAMP